jgi:hypothetical protein
MEIKIDESKIVDRIPRKLTFVAVVVLAILAYAMNVPEIDWRWVLSSVVVITLAGVASHTILELVNPEKPTIKENLTTENPK